MRRPGAQSRDARPLIAGVLLAAGRSLRFGRQKLFEPWGGEPLVRRAARNFLDARLAPVVAVVSSDRRFIDALAGLPLTVLVNDESELGISRSIAVGLEALPSTIDAALIGVADQPYLTAAGIAELVDAFSVGQIVVPRYENFRGNPPIFDRRFFPELMTLRGDHGGQIVVRAHPEAVVEICLPAVMGGDIDRPGDWPH